MREVSLSNRLMFLKDAIKFEFVKRKMRRYELLGERIELERTDPTYNFVNPLFPNDKPPLPLPHLERAMEHAISWDARAQALTEAPDD